MARYPSQKSLDNVVSPKESRHDLMTFPIVSDGPALTNDYTPKKSPRSGSDESIRNRPGRQIKGGMSKRDVPRDNGPVNGGPIMQEGTSVAGDMPWEQQQTSSVHGGFFERRAKRNGVKH